MSEPVVRRKRKFGSKVGDSDLIDKVFARFVSSRHDGYGYPLYECACCGGFNVLERMVFGNVEEKGFGVWCLSCYGELVFDVYPVVTGPTPNTPVGNGSSGGAEEPSPWQENAIKALEDGGADAQVQQELPPDAARPL